MDKEFNFTLELWEITDTIKKQIGLRDISVNALNYDIAIKKAWHEVNDSLTSHYFYRMELTE